MDCINCGCTSVFVKDSRDIASNNSIKRRRECKSCGYRFFTVESYQIKKMYVEKRNCKKQLFDRMKIFRAIQVVSRNRDIIKHLDKITNDICVYFEKNYSVPIQTVLIADQVMRHLKKYDDVAYVRFVSVYCKFESLHDFKDFIKKEYGSF